MRIVLIGCVSGKVTGGRGSEKPKIFAEVIQVWPLSVPKGKSYTISLMSSKVPAAGAYFIIVVP